MHISILVAVALVGGAAFVFRSKIEAFFSKQKTSVETDVSKVTSAVESEVKKV